MSGRMEGGWVKENHRCLIIRPILFVWVVCGILCYSAQTHFKGTMVLVEGVAIHVTQEMSFDWSTKAIDKKDHT